MTLPRLLIDLGTMVRNGTSFPAVPLIRCDEPDPAVAVLMVVPLHECCHPMRASSTLWKGLLGLPQNHGQVNRSHAMTLRLLIHDQPNQDKAPVHGAAEAGSD
jgi:hypothetical protein